MSQELVSIREYSRRRGTSDTAIHKAIRSGKIVVGLVEKGGKKFINPAVADVEWSSRRDPNYERKTQSGKLLFTDKNSEEVAPPSAQSASMASARTASAVYKAKILELEMKQKQGVLVERDQVYKALFVAGQEVRTSLLAIPDRFIDNILASHSRNEAHKLLYDAIADALEQLSELDKRELNSAR